MGKKGQLGYVFVGLTFLLFLTVLVVFWFLMAKSDPEGGAVAGFCGVKAEKCLTTQQLTLLGYLKTTTTYEGQTVNTADLIVNHFTGEKPISTKNLKNYLDSIRGPEECFHVSERRGGNEILHNISGDCKVIFIATSTMIYKYDNVEIDVTLNRIPLFIRLLPPILQAQLVK